MIHWLDAHTHLDSKELYPHKNEVLDRALQAGITRMMLVNSETTIESFERTLQCLEFSHAMERFACFGIHPHQASEYNEKWKEELVKRLAHPRVLALGEIGLDFYYNFSPQDIQRAVFRKQLDLALSLGLPVVIHCRDAYMELASILRETAESWRGMIHCFTGTPEEANQFLELGFYISFSGIVTFRSATILREAALAVPTDRMLIETDAPYLAPVPHRGKTNEPAFVAHTANFIAELKGLNPSEFSSQLFQNFDRLFLQ